VAGLVDALPVMTFSKVLHETWLQKPPAVTCEAGLCAGRRKPPRTAFLRERAQEVKFAHTSKSWDFRSMRASRSTRSLTPVTSNNCKQSDMDAKSVMQFVTLCEDNGIEFYIDGGWAVDALLGRQTRRHQELDIAVPERIIAELRHVLAERGFHDFLGHPATAYNFVLVDRDDRMVDIHAYTLDPAFRASPIMLQTSWAAA
jgi:hypothetical protein